VPAGEDGLTAETVTDPLPVTTHATSPLAFEVPEVEKVPPIFAGDVVVTYKVTPETGLPKRSTTLPVTTLPATVAETTRALVAVVEANVAVPVVVLPPAVTV